MYQMISATPSPFARRPRISLHEKGIQFELITEVPWDETTSTPQHNPLEKLPILLTDDHGSIYESQFILEFVEMMHPTPSLVPDDRSEFVEMRRLETLADGICDAFVLVFFERQRDAPSQPWIDRQTRKITNGIAALAEAVEGREYAIGDRFTRADIAIVTVCTYLIVRDEASDWLRKYPGLAAYCKAIEERDAFKATYPVPQTITDAVV